MKEVITIPGAPQRPFSSAIRAGDYIFLSGQGGAIDDTGNEIKTIEGQTNQCLKNMKKVLDHAGSSLNDIVKVTIFLGDAAHFSKMNEIYREYFPGDLPARSTAITGLAIPRMLVEIECIAYTPINK